MKLVLTVLLLVMTSQTFAGNADLPNLVCINSDGEKIRIPKVDYLVESQTTQTGFSPSASVRLIDLVLPSIPYEYAAVGEFNGEKDHTVLVAAGDFYTILKESKIQIKSEAGKTVVNLSVMGKYRHFSKCHRTIF